MRSASVDKSELVLMDDAQLQAHIDFTGRQMLAANELLQANATDELRTERRRWWDAEAAALRERNRRITVREEAS
jgi:imidazoleglycerol phosphate dehydratase HisB